MAFEEMIPYALPVAFALVGVALVWLVVELALTVRSGRKTLDKINTEIDPMMNRVNLTLDAANLEILRVDAILEDVSQITDTMANATTTVDKLAQAPVSAVSSVTDRVRNVLKSSKAGKSSAELAAARREAAAQPEEAPAEPEAPAAEATESKEEPSA